MREKDIENLRLQKALKEYQNNIGLVKPGSQKHTEKQETAPASEFEYTMSVNQNLDG